MISHKQTRYLKHKLGLIVLVSHLSTRVLFGAVTAEESVQQVQKMLHQQQYPSAIVYLEGLAPNQHTQQTKQLLGQAYFATKQYRKAITTFQASLSLLGDIHTKDASTAQMPTAQESTQNNSLLLQQTNQQQTHSQAAQNYPIKAQLYTWISLCYQRLNNLTQALHWILKSRDLVPEDPIAWTNLGQIYLKLAQYNNAEQSYLTAYRFDTNLRSTLYGLLQTYQAQKNYPKAAQYGLRLIELYPRQPLYYIEVAKIYQQQHKLALFHEFQSRGRFLLGQYNQVLQHLEQIPNLQSKIDLYLLLIATLIKSQQFNKAKEQLDKGIKRYPKNQELQLNLAQLYYRQARYKQCIQFSLTYLKQHPNATHDWHVLIGHSYLEQEDKINAAKYYEKALAQQQNDILTREKLAHVYRQSQQRPMELFHQGVVYFYVGQFEEAREILSWLDASFERQSELNYYLGLVFWSLNEKDKAIHLFKKAMNQNAKTPTQLVPLYLALSRAYQQTNQLSKAKGVVQNLLKRNPQLISHQEVIGLKKQLKML